MMTLNNNEKDFQKKMQKDTEIPAIVHEHINQAYHENRRQGSRRYGSGTGGRIYILCNQSSNGKEYSGCRRAF